MISLLVDTLALAFAVWFFALKLTLLWLVLVLVAEEIERALRPGRVRLAERGDQGLDFPAALGCGPLPPYGQEHRP